MSTPANTSSPNKKSNTTTSKTQTLFQILVLCSKNDFEDVLTEKLKQLYKLVTLADDNIKPIGKNMGTNAIDVKNFFTGIILDGKLHSEHAFFSQKNPSHNFLSDPLELMKKGVKGIGYPYIPSPKNSKPNSSQKFEVKIGQHSKGKPKGESSRSMSKDQIGNLRVPHSTKEVLGKYAEGVQNISDSEADSQNQDISMRDFQIEFNKVFNKFKGQAMDRLKVVENDIKAQVSKTDKIQEEVDEVKIANEKLDLELKTEKNKIDKAHVRLDNQANDIISVKDNVAKLAATKITLSADLTKYQIMQFLEKAKFNRNEYLNAIFNAQKAGRFGIDINAKRNGLYITTDNTTTPPTLTLNCEAVEVQLGLLVHITDIKLINRKDDLYTAYFTLDCNFSKRRGIGNNLIKNRSGNIGHFGLRLDVPMKYNIDHWLRFVQKEKLNEAGEPIIFDFDRTKQGAYVIYVNDYRENGWRKDEVDGKGRPIQKRDSCSRIFPWNPLDFAMISEENFTKANLLKLVDSKRFFTYGGHVMEIPDDVKPESAKSKVVATSITANSWNFGAVGK